MLKAPGEMCIRDRFYTAKKTAKEHLQLQSGDEIIITAGLTNGQSGTTNLLKVETI